MTPQDIFEFKLRWEERYQVFVHSDLEHKATSWCKSNVDKHLWHMLDHTNVYEHTYLFRYQEHAKMFETYLRSDYGKT